MNLSHTTPYTVLTAVLFSLGCFLSMPAPSLAAEKIQHPISPQLIFPIPASSRHSPHDKSPGPEIPGRFMRPVENGRWRQVGPGGSGGTLDVAMHPVTGTLLVSSDMGRSLLQSKDKATSFQAIAPEGHPTLDVLVPHPSVAGVWYAGFSSPKGAGLFKSADDGVGWSLVRTDEQIAGQTVFGLVITGPPDTLIWLTRGRGPVISLDGGITFSDFSQGLLPQNMPDHQKNISAQSPLLATEHKGKQHIFLAGKDGLYRRELTAASWEKIHQLPDTPVTALSYDSVKQWVWAGNSDDDLYSGDLDTDTWQKAAPGPPSVTLLRTHSQKPGWVWCFSHGRAGLFRSADRGLTWEWLTRRLLVDNSDYKGNLPRDFRHRTKFQRDYFFILPDDPMHLLLGDMYASRDGGTSWQFSATRYRPQDNTWQGNGLTLLTSYRAWWDELNPNRVYLGFSDTGLMRSDDRGKSIKALWSSQYPDLYSLAYWSRQMLDTSGSCTAFAADPDHPDTQFYGMSGKGGKNSVCGMVFKTQTNGRHWSPVMPSKDGLPNGMITDMVLLDGNGYDNRIVYVLVNSLAPDQPPIAGIYRSQDSGTSFAKLADTLSSDLVFPLMNLDYCKDQPDILYAAASSEGGNRAAKNLKKIAKKQMDPGGIFRSDDAGATWQKAGGPELAGAVQVAVHPNNPNIAFAAVADGPENRGGIYRTLDSGSNWTLVLGKTQIFPILDNDDALVPVSVAINPVLPAIVYAAVNRAGVFRSMDNGNSWEPVDWAHLKKYQGTYHTLTINPHDPAEFYLALFGNSFLAYRDPVAAKALEQNQPGYALVQNGDFERMDTQGKPVHWTWSNLTHPTPQGTPILSIQKAPDRKGMALRIKMSGDPYENPLFTGSNQAPITFLAHRLSAYALSVIRGKTVQISFEIYSRKLKATDIPILSLMETRDDLPQLIGELPASLAYSNTPYEKITIKKNRTGSDQWVRAESRVKISPDARALNLILHTTEKNQQTDYFLDNIRIQFEGGFHGQ
ncbi:MAG: hypothetical protein KKC20_05065 [Proteobacteria bacterium]|nr:hypothetical protein [Pseudomonadota bacterium]